MSQIKEPIEQGSYYHIYNRGNNRCDVFFDSDSYYYFLKLYDKYITPVADTLAWCLLKNHFHILVYIKLNHEINQDKLEFSTVEKPKVISASKQFSHLFNAYTQGINKKFNRTGSLFESRFERKKITSDAYLQKVIFYIHNNPVHHGFTKNINLYPWSSYETIISDKPTKLKREDVIEFYQNKENFIEYHNSEQNLQEINTFIIE